MKYILQFTIEFEKRLQIVKKKDSRIFAKVKKTVEILSDKPDYPSLNTHLVNTSKYGKCFSSRVTGNLRILWIYKKNRLVILVLTLGDHSGKNRVY